MSVHESIGFRVEGSIYGGELGVSQLSSDPTEAGLLNSDLFFVPFSQMSKHMVPSPRHERMNKARLSSGASGCGRV